MEDDKKVFKLVAKEKPPEDEPGVTPNELFKENIDSFEDVILIGWNGDQFKICWSEGYSPEEVNLQIDLAKQRLLHRMFEF